MPIPANAPANASDVLKQAFTAFKDRQTNYGLFRAYYDGKHRLQFATQKFENAFGNLFREFAVNICPVIVDTVGDRLLLHGFKVVNDDEGEEVAEDSDDNKQVMKDIRQIWLKNRMDEKTRQVHKEALKVGDSYVIVWPDANDAGFPKIHPQKAENIYIKYDEEYPDVPIWAAKMWVQADKRYRLTIYTPTQIAKYVTSQPHPQGPPQSSDAFVPAQGPQDASWPVMHNYERVPVFAFNNGAGLDNCGRSELHDVIAVQDAINKTVMDMLVGQEFYAFPQRYVTGITLTVGQDGKVVEPFKAASDRVLATGNEKANFGQFQQADLSVLHENVKGFIQLAAIVSRTPIHFVTAITGNWPSGESLKTAESTFLAKVSDCAVVFGNDWEDVIHFCRRIINRSSEVRLEASWQDPTPRAEQDMYNAIKILADAGTPLELAAKVIGFSDVQIRIFAEADRVRKEEREAALEQFRANQEPTALQPGQANDDQGRNRDQQGGRNSVPNARANRGAANAPTGSVSRQAAS